MENNQQINEGAKIVWSRRGGKLTKKYRCTDGVRKNRIVNNPADCNKPKDFKKRRQMIKNLASKGGKMRRKARKTKRVNPVSRMVSRMNKSRKK